MSGGPDNLDITPFIGLLTVAGISHGPQEIDGKDYLFVEAGGFRTRNKPGWKSQLLVLER